MKATELMLGDYVINTEFNKSEIDTIECIEEYRVWLKHGKTYIALEYIQPIPLTPEILEKNGFKRVPQSECFNPYHWLLKKYEEQSEGLLYRITAYITPFRGMCVIINNHADCETINFRKQIEHIHELQQALRLCGIDKEIEYCCSTI